MHGSCRNLIHFNDGVLCSFVSVEQAAQSLPSVQVNPRPIPTRVPGSPSPRKGHAKWKSLCISSQHKGKRINVSENALNTSSGSLQDMEAIFQDWEENDNQDRNGDLSSDKPLVCTLLSKLFDVRHIESTV